MPKAYRLEDAYNNFSSEPISSPDEFREFYVERPKPVKSPISTLKISIIHAKKPEKYLFLGFRGSGKSTEINRLLNELDDEKFIKIKFSIKDTLDISDFDYRDFFILLSLQIYNVVKNQKIKVKDDFLEDFERFLYDVTHEAEKIEEEEYGKKKELEGGIDIKVLSAKIGSEAATRTVIRRKLATRIGDLIERTNNLIGEIERKTEKRIIVAVDDLDKLTRGEQSEKFFYTNTGLLLQPKCLVIYTFPIPLAFNPRFENVTGNFSDTFILPQVPVKDRHGREIKENIDFYRAIVERRMDLSLIDGAALKEATLATGKIREFIILLRSSVAIALANGNEKITENDVIEAIEKLRRNFDRELDKVHIKRLIEIHETKDARSESPDDQITRELLFSLSAVEYEDEEGRWADVNPLLHPLIERWKKSFTKK